MTITKGNIVVENIKVGDIHYEFEYNVGIKSEVIVAPHYDEDGKWSWKSKNLTSGEIIDYSVGESKNCMLNLYDYEAYKVKLYI